MYPIHTDIVLTPEQQKRVLDWVREMNFHLPGADPSDFTRVIPRARYAGWDFMSEDLDSFLIGLVCSKPGYEHQRTFIRMSYDQLMGNRDAKVLPLNEPVLARDALRMSRWRDEDFNPGPDCFRADAGVARDLVILNDTLQDIVSAYSRSHELEERERYDFAVDWGVLLAGRYPRLCALRKAGRLNGEQEDALRAFERAGHEATAILEACGLPTLTSLDVPEARAHAAHHS